MTQTTISTTVIEQYRQAWKQAHERFPAKTEFHRKCRKTYVADCMKNYNIPLQQVGSWMFIREDWASELNRLAFEKGEK